MANINYVDPIEGTTGELDFADLVTLIKGASISSLAIADDFFELGLTDAFNLRIQGKTSISLISTLNKAELPPVRLQILKDGEVATAQAVEKRLHALRQLYAATFLVNAGRADEIANFKQPEWVDLEELLAENERLFVSAASEGSFWVTVVTKTIPAFKSLSNILPLFYSEGRTALLERIRAKTELKKLAVEQKRQDMAFERASKSIDLAQKVAEIKDPWVRQQTERHFSVILGILEKEPLALPPPDQNGAEE
jgi:hypothetical protein